MIPFQEVTASLDTQLIRAALFLSYHVVGVPDPLMSTQSQTSALKWKSRGSQIDGFVFLTLIPWMLSWYFSHWPSIDD